MANIGLLGVDRKGEEYYQLTLGGDAGEDAAIGQIAGPSFGEGKWAPRRSRKRCMAPADIVLIARREIVEDSWACLDDAAPRPVAISWSAWSG